MTNTYIDYLLDVLHTAYEKVEEDRARTFEAFVKAEDGSVEEKRLDLRLQKLKQAKRNIGMLVGNLYDIRSYNNAE